MQPYSCDSQTTFCGLHSVFICLPHIFSSQSFDLIVVACNFLLIIVTYDVWHREIKLEEQLRIT